MIEGTDLRAEPAFLHSFYGETFSYYNTLDRKHQALFVKRCGVFMNSKQIVASDGGDPSNKIKALVAASAVQLTLGLETWSLDYFETIIVHAGDFKNMPTGLLYSGETNLSGYIRLSWQSFLRGYKFEKDNLNLGIHEFAHAMRFNTVRGHPQDYFVEHYFDSWLACAYEAFNDIRAGNRTIFRKYGGTNINEFVSVCIEHFFESPEDILQQYPLLFYSTAALLNQLPGKETRVGIRTEMLQQKTRAMHGFAPQQLHGQPSNALLVMLFPLGFTMLASGVFSGISVFMSGLFFLLLLRQDFFYTRLTLGHKEFVVQKGRFIFRGRRNYTNPVSCLVSARHCGGSFGHEEVELIYYNMQNGYFYEETLLLRKLAYEQLVHDVRKNRTAFFGA